ncbi:MAG: hypothetical protein KAS18_10770, partial [Calditrichia bacterium]|nr:hypothetical protein [Calditrichia bacterium]
MKKLISISLLLCFTTFAQEVIDISVKGISDSKNEGAQKDRKEAVMDAKRQACEKAGLQIKSKTTVENFQTVFDYIESESEALLLPGFQIIDIGYVADGTYQVVLTGKIKTVVEEKISAKELRYAKSLYDRKKYSECKQILEKYINNKDNNAPEALQEESLYLYIKWGFSFNAQEDCEKYAAFYPDSPKVAKLLKYGEFSAKPIIKYSKDFAADHTKWVEGEFEVDGNIFKKLCTILADRIWLEDFIENVSMVSVQFILYKDNETNPNKSTAYRLIIKYWHRDYVLNSGEDGKLIDDRIKIFNNSGSKTFQASSSGKWFENFK